MIHFWELPVSLRCQIAAKLLMDAKKMKLLMQTTPGGIKLVVIGFEYTPPKAGDTHCSAKFICEGKHSFSMKTTNPGPFELFTKECCKAIFPFKLDPENPRALLEAAQAFQAKEKTKARS